MGTEPNCQQRPERNRFRSGVTGLLLLGPIHTDHLRLLLRLRFHLASIVVDGTIHTKRWQISAIIKENHRKRKC